MLKLILVGHVGSDATIRPAGEGLFINFSVANNFKERNKQGELITKTQWINCSYYCTEDKISKWIIKGKQVACVGQATAYAYTDKEGGLTAGLSMKVSEIQLLGSNDSKESEVEHA